MTKQLSPEVDAKYAQLREQIRGFGRALIAFSGGVDSSLVAYVANQELGANALAVTSGSKSLKRSDLDLTRELAKSWSMNHRVIYTDELTKESYRANPVNRCFHCKTSLYDLLTQLASKEGFEYILNGTNVDDLGDHRPGLIAASNYNIHSPLVETEFHKQDIRELAAFLGMENAEKPQAACLSSRVPYGSHIDESILNQIEQAENALADIGFKQFRVRHHGEVARIEIAVEEMQQAFEQRDRIHDELKASGYSYVSLDLAGFRSGSLNETLQNVVQIYN